MEITSKTKRYCQELIYAALEILSRAAIIMLNFLYGKGKISDLYFILLVCSIQILGSLLFIKTLVYDRGKITDSLQKIKAHVQNKTSNDDKQSSDNKQHSSKGSFDEKNTDKVIELQAKESTANCEWKKEYTIGIMVTLQVMYILGSTIAPFLHKKEYINTMSYISIFICAFCIGIIPTVCFRRMQTAEHLFLIEEIQIEQKSKTQNELI